MNGCFDLEKLFPTDESRYNAYIYWIIDSIILLLIIILTSTSDSLLLKIISVLSELSLLVVNIYLTIYVWNKRKILKTMFRMVGSFFLGAIISLIISNSLFKYIPPPSTIVAFIFCVLPVCLIATMNKKKFQRVSQIFGDKFVKYTLILIVLHIVIPYILLFLSLCYGILSNYSYTAANWSVTLLLLSYILFFLSEPIFIIYVFRKESESVFYNTLVRFYFAEFLLLYCIFAVTAFWDGDTLIDSVDSSIKNFDYGLDDVDHYYRSIDDSTGEFNDNVNENFIAESNSVPSNDVPVVKKDSSVNGSVSANDTFLHKESLKSPINDLPNIELIEFFGNTNMADIPQIQYHPFIIFNDPSVPGIFQICDSSGTPQMTISNGNIVNSEYVVIGHVSTDAEYGTTVYTDVNNNPLYSVDMHGQMFSGNQYIGNKIISGNFTEFRDMHQHIIAIQDKETGIWCTPDGKILCQVKQI